MNNSKTIKARLENVDITRHYSATSLPPEYFFTNGVECAYCELTAEFMSYVIVSATEVKPYALTCYDHAEFLDNIQDDYTAYHEVQNEKRLGLR